MSSIRKVESQSQNCISLFSKDYCTSDINNDTPYEREEENIYARYKHRCVEDKSIPVGSETCLHSSYKCVATEINQCFEKNKESITSSNHTTPRMQLKEDSEQITSVPPFKKWSIGSTTLPSVDFTGKEHSGKLRKISDHNKILIERKTSPIWESIEKTMLPFNDTVKNKSTLNYEPFERKTSPTNQKGSKKSNSINQTIAPPTFQSSHSKTHDLRTSSLNQTTARRRSPTNRIIERNKSYSQTPEQNTSLTNRTLRRKISLFDSSLNCKTSPLNRQVKRTNLQGNQTLAQKKSSFDCTLKRTTSPFDQLLSHETTTLSQSIGHTLLPINRKLEQTISNSNRTALFNQTMEQTALPGNRTLEQKESVCNRTLERNVITCNRIVEPRAFTFDCILKQTTAPLNGILERKMSPRNQTLERESFLINRTQKQKTSLRNRTMERKYLSNINQTLEQNFDTSPAQTPEPAKLHETFENKMTQSYQTFTNNRSSIKGFCQSGDMTCSVNYDIPNKTLIQTERKFYNKNHNVWDRLYPYKSVIPTVVQQPNPRSIKPVEESFRCGMDWHQYQRLDVIHAFLDELESKFPSLCSVGVIGKSVEGRALKILKISNGDARNSAVWMDAGIHAREWIAPAVNTFVANHIARNFDKLPPCCTNKDWYFLPVVNPDGYEYSHTNDRMWRKSRTVYGNKVVGVDLNRNFSFNWGGRGSSHNPSHHFYRGTEPFSEPESCALRNVLLDANLSFKVYITLHAFGEVIIFPYASSPHLCPDYIRLLKGATVMSRAIYDTNGNTYKVGISKDVMYHASGTSNDWCYGTVGIPYCYLIELRSKKHKFKLPQEEIEETGCEILNCILALMDFVDTYPLEERKEEQED